MDYNLIVPVAADKPEYGDGTPYLFCPMDDGIPLCVKSVLGLNLFSAKSIIFTVLKSHDDRFGVSSLIWESLARIGLARKSDVLVLDKPTNSQAETVAKTIQSFGIRDCVMIKDGDCYFEAEIHPGNHICVFPLDSLTRVNPQDKSYVAVNDAYFITNIIERRIVSRWFCAGGYVFRSADMFMDYYSRFESRKGLYLSHLVYSMLLDRVNFRPVECSSYLDWGKPDDLEISKV